MLTFEDVLAAQDRVSATARHTPLDYSHTFSAMTGADVHLKLELFQRTGSFKIRGATNRIATLSAAEQDAGVVTASAGNHAQGVALAATRIGVDSTIVMPEHAPISKVRATRNYGGEVELYGQDYDAAAERAHEIERDEGKTYVHAFDDWQVMAGQGTIGLEIAEDLPSVDTVVVPIGGGGLISGIATALKGKVDDVPRGWGPGRGRLQRRGLAPEGRGRRPRLRRDHRRRHRDPQGRREDLPGYRGARRRGRHRLRLGRLPSR